jgi:transglutaminase-like putative cysteine protease
MKRLLTLLTILFVMNFSSALGNYNTNEELTIDFYLNSEIELSGSGTLKNLLATVFLVPLTDNLQNVISLLETSSPTAEIEFDEDIKYTWKEESENYEFGYSSVIKTQNKLYKVPEVSFPYENIPEELNEYLQPQEITDLNSDIIQKTSEIIENEDNAYLAVHEIAGWIYTNIDYDLNTVTETAAKKSSWVIENRQGVCDEITSLFISMTRSIGIPARFVSGMAYTNVYDNFGNHGWAEVYYPNYGWVPYDVTFDQFGWIDPSHIALQKTLDAGESSITYRWESTGSIDLDSKEISTIAEITAEGDQIDPVFDISLKAIKDTVAPGSYVPMRVRIENPFNGYISDQITITKAPGLTERNYQVVALKPKETRDIFWIVEIPDNAQENYVYTTTIELNDLFGSTDTEEITFATGSGYEYISLEEAEEIVEDLTPEDNDFSSNQIVLSCNPEKDYYYSYHTANIICNFRSINNALNNLEICIKENCETFSIQSNKEKNFEFQIQPSNNPVKVTLKNSEINVGRTILLNYQDGPEIKITPIDIYNINYDEEIDIPITINSKTPLKNIKINLNRFEAITFDSLDGTKSFTLSSNSKHLNSEKINLKIEFEDEEGNSYSIEHEQDLKINNLPWYWKFINLFRG